MLFILENINIPSLSLRDHIEAEARKAQYPLTEDATLATFVIGMRSDLFPDGTPPENKIILMHPGRVVTVPSGAHLFSYHNLTLIGGSLTLSEFLQSKLNQ